MTTEQEKIDFDPKQRLVFDREPLNVAMSRSQLELICGRLIQGSKKPTLDVCLPWLWVCVGLLFALVPADFKDFLGVGASVWEAVVLLGVILSAFVFSQRLYQVWKHRKDKVETAESIVAKIVSEMQSSSRLSTPETSELQR